VESGLKSTHGCKDLVAVQLLHITPDTHSLHSSLGFYVKVQIASAAGQVEAS